jgi:superfamily I DNA/RNA helicase
MTASQRIFHSGERTRGKPVDGDPQGENMQRALEETTKWDDDLQGPALRIAAYLGSPLRVCAGPGTGKSTALRRRVMRLLEEGEDPDRIFLVTFTRNAAR